MKLFKTLGLILALGSFGLTACQTTDPKATPTASKAEAAAPAATVMAGPKLDPMPQPTYEVGHKAVGVDSNGNEVTLELVVQDDESRTWRRSDGCTWTSPRGGFAPSKEWSGCGGRDGSAFVKLWKGQPWPLKVGNSWQYDIDGNGWSDSRKCEVVGTETITVPAGTFDTFKVVCKHNSSTRTSWMSPVLKTSVKYVRVGSRPSSWELKKIIRGGATSASK